MKPFISTRGRRKFDREWKEHGGCIECKRGTGEDLYLHPLFPPLRVNGRRESVPACLITRLNRILRTEASNDAHFSRPGGPTARRC